MVPARSIVVAAAGLLSILLGGCVSTHTRMAQAADRLQESASAFAAAGGNYASTGYSEQARAFADQARDFRETVGSGGDLRVVWSYKQLWRGYHALRDAVARSHQRQARVDLKPVSKAFVKVQRIAKNGYSYADSTVYALGGYYLNPYYN
jgi:hypothetical protein